MVILIRPSVDVFTKMARLVLRNTAISLGDSISFFLSFFGRSHTIIVVAKKSEDGRSNSTVSEKRNRLAFSI